MPTMLRKQIYIAPCQERLLKTKASELHISESELIREGIDKALQILSNGNNRSTMATCCKAAG